MTSTVREEIITLRIPVGCINACDPKAHLAKNKLSHQETEPWSTAYNQLESAVCWFLPRGENRRTRRKTLEAEKKTNTNSTHLWRLVRESNLCHIGGRRVLSPLRHPCSPPFLTFLAKSTRIYGKFCIINNSKWRYGTAH